MSTLSAPLFFLFDRRVVTAENERDLFSSPKSPLDPYPPCLFCRRLSEGKKLLRCQIFFFAERGAERSVGEAFNPHF